MKLTHRAGLALIVAAAVASPALAGDPVKERANILAVDWQAMQVRLKDPQGRETTWKVSPNAEVEFKDKASAFPNPKLADLVPPMYVHFTYDSETKEIQRFEVAQVGFEPTPRPAANVPAAAQTQSAVITAVDLNAGQVEVQLGSGRRTYWVEPKEQLRAFKAGDRVTLQIAKQGDKEVVTRIRRR
jgi:Cu/Ag efflux protein CusF